MFKAYNSTNNIKNIKINYVQQSVTVCHGRNTVFGINEYVQYLQQK